MVLVIVEAVIKVVVLLVGKGHFCDGSLGGSGKGYDDLGGGGGGDGNGSSNSRNATVVIVV